jgi:hypothetical protein
MIQLVQPDLNATGRIGFCLEYASRNVFHNPQGGTNAWAAWNATQFKHLDQNFPDVSILCWFSFYQAGVNLGHVVVYVPGQGFYSSPWQTGTSHAILGSISEVERIYGAKYVGWSEDILNLKVAEEGDDMSTIGDTEARILIKWMYGYTNELDIEGAIPAIVGGESNTVIRRMDSTPTAAAYAAQIKQWQQNTQPVPSVVINGTVYVPKV